MGKDSVAKYAGASSRHSQRVVCSEAVLRKWDMATTDISKAFLQGVTYKELAELTGEPLRVVNFDLPAYCLPFLLQDMRTLIIEKKCYTVTSQELGAMTHLDASP